MYAANILKHLLLLYFRLCCCISMGEYVEKKARTECVQACLASLINQSVQNEINNEKSIPTVQACMIC